MRGLVLVVVCWLSGSALALQMVYLVDDPLIDAVAYRVDGRSLSIYFRSGEVRVYREVPLPVARRLLNSCSPTETYWVEIEGRFPMDRIVGPHVPPAIPAARPREGSRKGAKGAKPKLCRDCGRQVPLAQRSGSRRCTLRDAAK